MFLESGNKYECMGCEGCVQICAKNALKMIEDEEGFRYPQIDNSLCIRCGLCRKVCPFENMPEKHDEDKYVYGGYNKNHKIRFESTSGGAFSAIIDAICTENYVIFGAEAKGLQVFHNYITDKSELWRFRKSKYSQSTIGRAYKKAREFLSAGKTVVFSGTPCQIAGLMSYLGDFDKRNLLTIEVVCEGVPSPLYIRKLDKAIENKYGKGIASLDYRYTGKSIFFRGKWDFENMRITTNRRKKTIIIDRWFNPFWSIWLQHLMSRPSCYECKFTSVGRVADITLGDLWGVHIYCPELYGNNGGSSLIICNTSKGKRCFAKAKERLYGHKLNFDEAIKYQGPLRKSIEKNINRNDFIKDLQGDMSYQEINKKWAKKPTVKLLFQKYIWGNRQKVFFWNIKKRIKK